MKQTLIAVAVAALSFASSAQVSQTAECPVGASSCTGSNQSLGDVTTTTNTGDTRSNASPIGTSSASNASGVDINPNFDNRAQTTQNTTGTISGGNTTSGATGGAAVGNRSDIDNRSSVGNVSTGPATAQNGGNITGGNNLETGPSSAQVGDTTAAGGAGGAGGKGGNAAGGNAAQQQGIDRSGNSRNDVNSRNDQGQSQGQTTRNDLSNDSSSASAAHSSSGGNTLNNGSNSGGNTQKTNASADGSGNSQTTVDASDRSSTHYESKTTVWAPVVHGAAAPALAAGQIVMAPDTCGPRVNIVRRDVTGVRFGVWGGQSEVLQGYDEVVAPAGVAFIQNGPYLIGHKVTTYTATLGTSSAGSLSIGGFGKSGEGAQGGGATSGSLQQMVQRHTVRECIMANEVVAPVAPPVAAVVVPAITPVGQLPAQIRGTRNDRN